MANPILDFLTNGNFKKEILTNALLLKDKDQESLHKLARDKRREFFPSDEVEVRSVIEISNMCQQSCNFCNINLYSKKNKYMIKHEELIGIVRHLYQDKERRVFLIQSGELAAESYIDFVSKAISDIKRNLNDLIIILCLGNLSYNQYKQLHDSGADRYILKFETSNPLLYNQIKPSDTLTERLKCIKMLTELGFEVGSGNMIGLPGQTLDDIVNDLLFLGTLKLTMASTSVFFPGEESNYRNESAGDPEMALNYMALLRIMYPNMLIPTTSCLEKVKKDGQYLGLMAGANTVTIHDGTPEDSKKHFPIYSINRFTPDEKHLKDIVRKADLKFSSSHLKPEATKG